MSTTCPDVPYNYKPVEGVDNISICANYQWGWQHVSMKLKMTKISKSLKVQNAGNIAYYLENKL